MLSWLVDHADALVIAWLLVNVASVIALVPVRRKRLETWDDKFYGES